MINKHFLKKLVRYTSLALLAFGWHVVAQGSVTQSNSVNKNTKDHPKSQSKSDSSDFVPPKNLASLLGWVPTTSNICLGYFKQPTSVTSPVNILPMSEQLTHIAATGSTTFLRNGETILRDNVVTTQTGRIAQSDIAHIYRNVDTGKITHIKIRGHVRLVEKDRLVVAESGILNLTNNYTYLYHVLYNFFHKVLQKKRYTWGSAKTYTRLTSGNTVMHDATYSVCNPTDPCWQLHAKKLTLNHTTQVGVARDAVLRFKNIPIFYTPYLSFSLDHSRKSGFLMPSPAYSSQRGLRLGVPYYWNMAPNYDMTLTPYYNSKRGFELGSYFQYLTPSSRGNIEIVATPHDHAFKDFKTSEINQKNPPATELPYINELKSDSNARAYLHFDNATKFNDEWRGQFNLNYVTDSYFFNDYSTNLSQILADQLLNQASIDYVGDHWQSTLLFQAYQTLHMLDSGTTVYNQYKRLPELDVAGHYFLSGYDLDLSGQLVNFAYSSDFPSYYTYQKPIGPRFHFSPSLGHTFSFPFGYVSPKITVDNTSYLAELPTAQANQTRPSTTLSRTLPIVDLDAGLYVQRSFKWDDQSYLQTFEPRLFYLYVPYLNQAKYPNFDTVQLPFSYDQLFALNQYTGFDRLQNADQVTLGMTNRVLTQDSSSQKLEADFGIIYYFTPPQVSLGSTPLQSVTWSPLVGQLIFYPFSHVSTTASAAWDFSKKEMNNAVVSVSYTKDSSRLVSFGYSFVHANDATPLDQYGYSNNSNFIDLGAAWPITPKISALGYVYFNISHRRPNNYYAGLQYNSCCYAFRFIYNQQFEGDDGSGNPNSNRYNRAYYVQFELKGLGGVGHSSSDLLSSTLPAYQDIFSNK